MKRLYDLLTLWADIPEPVRAELARYLPWVIVAALIGYVVYRFTL